MKQIEITVKNKIFYVKAEKIGSQIWFHWQGRAFVIKDVFQEQATSLKASSQPVAGVGELSGDEALKNGHVLSPMPGRVVKIFVQEGDRVQKNQPLLILAAMKMEYTVKTLISGQVQSIEVKEAQSVGVDQKLIIIT